MNHRATIVGALAPQRVEVLNVPAWADRFRVLDPSIASTPGQFRTSRVEVARGPMMAVTEPGVRTITIMSATQLMKTTIIENVIGYHMHQRPSPILAVLPKAEAAKNFGKERLSALVRATPVLADIVAENAGHRSLESQTFRQFPGGYIACEGAGSPTNLASRPIRVTLLDEIDKYELTKEGDPVLLAEERASTFRDALHIRCCSPTDDEGRIWKSYLESDQRRPFVACPHCGHEQTLEFFKHVHWPKSPDGKTHFPMNAAIWCEACGAEWVEQQRLALMTTEGAVRWMQTRPFECCEVHQEPLKARRWDWDADNLVGRALCTECGKPAVSNAHAGFTASKLFSPFVTVATLAETWLRVKDDLEQKRVFVNTALAQPFAAEAGRNVEAQTLVSRREDFGSALPREIVRLTAGVDVQGNRLECHVMGWGLFEEAWSVHYQVLEGDPANPDVWNRLDDLLKSRFPHALGVSLPISATCVDSGHLAQKVHDFCRPLAFRNVWAIKGSSWSRKGDPVWPVPKSSKFREKGNKPVIISVDSAKDFLRAMMMVNSPGPGFLHIPQQRSEAWCEQLVAERCIFERKGGATTRKWVLPKGRANEALDTLTYAYAALCGLKSRGLNLEKVAAEFEARAAQYRAKQQEAA